MKHIGFSRTKKTMRAESAKHLEVFGWSEGKGGGGVLHRGTGGGGGYLFVACLSNWTIDNAFLSR